MGMCREKPVESWLGACVVFCLGMVVLGGITRLTHSGLSLVEWAPILGVIPPLSEESWQVAFSKYQLHSQFKLQNSTMTLSEFKWIYFWEYLHRLAARTVGVVFFLPLVFFWVRKKLTGKQAIAFLGIFLIGGLQGLVGWLMVKSGLGDDPKVNPIRLAIHFSLAMGILGLIEWSRLKVQRPTLLQTGFAISRLARVFLVAIAVQLFYGALVAGLRAGTIFNTYPMMNGEWFPSGAFAMGSGIENLVVNPVLVQWVHRGLGTLLGLSGIVLMLTPQLRMFRQLGGLLTLQAFLGVATLLYSVPVSLGVIHQLMGAIVFLVALRLVYLTQHQGLEGSPSLLKNSSRWIPLRMK